MSPIETRVADARASLLRLAVTGVLLVAAPALAADRATDSETRAGATTLDEVVVIGRWGQFDRPGRRAAVTLDATGLPAPVSVVTNDELGTINYGRDVSNLFRRVPGVVANSLDQGETGNGFRMRGFATQGTHGADVAVYVDGVPQNVPSSEAGAGHGPAFLEWLTPALVSRLEVIKGPVSALHGDQNRAGAVNVWTFPGGPASRVALGLESYGGRRGTAGFSGELGDFRAFAHADVYRTDSHRDGAWTDRDNLAAGFTTVRGERRYSLRVNHYRADFVAAGYLRYDQLAAGLVGRSAPEPNALAPFGSGRRTALAFNAQPAEGDAGWHATLYAEDFERERGASGGGLVHNVGTDDRVIAGGRLGHHFVYGDTASLHVGTEFRWDDGDGIRRRWQNRMPTATYLTNLDMDLRTAGLYAQGQYRPVPSLKLSAGLRGDWFDYDIENRKLPAASTDYRDSVFTPKLGAVWSASPRLDLFANVAQGFRSPAAQQISPAGAAGPLGAAGGVVNDGISPSKVESYDAGFVALLASRWTATGAFFYTLNEDEIVQTAPNVFASVGSTTRRGVELESRVQLTPGLSAYASYTRLLQAEIDDAPVNSAFLLSVPRHQAKVGAEYDRPLGAGRLRLNADAYTTRGIPYFSGTPLRRLEVPSYVRYDLRAAWSVGRLEVAASAIVQPHLISEAFFATAAGLFVSPQPREHYGFSFSYAY